MNPESIPAPSIELQELTVGYDGHAVVSGLDVTLPGGEISVILGPSGCGKSTVLKHILRLNEPMQGTIRIGGHDILGLSKGQFSCIKQRMGVLFQDGALLGSLTLADNVALPLKEHTRLNDRDIRERVMEKLSMVGLNEAADRFPSQLSGGMRKRAGLARAMVMNPSILFCDEPTSGLDPINSAELDKLLLDHQERFNMTIVVVSHDLASTWAIADYVVVLGKGRSLFQGRTEELKKTEDPYLRRFLDRVAEEGVRGGKDSLTPIEPSVMKVDCSRYWQSMDS